MGSSWNQLTNLVGFLIESHKFIIIETTICSRCGIPFYTTTPDFFSQALALNWVPSARNPAECFGTSWRAMVPWATKSWKPQGWRTSDGKLVFCTNSWVVGELGSWNLRDVMILGIVRIPRAGLKERPEMNFLRYARDQTVNVAQHRYETNLPCSYPQLVFQDSISTLRAGASSKQP